MKRLRILVVLVFVLSAVYSGNYFYQLEAAEDDTYPEIHFDSEILETSVQNGEDVWLQGVSAFDAKDGDVTSSIMVESLSRFTEKGHRVITYAAFDGDGHVTKASREMIYTDYTSPRFEITRPLRYGRREPVDLLDGVSVQDCLDGDITYKVKAEADGGVGQNSVKNYGVVYSVANSAGDVVTMPVTVRVYDEAAPDYVGVNLTDYITYIKAGEGIDPQSYLDNFTIDGTDYRFGEILNPYAQPENQFSITRDQVRIRSRVQSQTPGIYTITYTLYTGLYTGAVDLIVVVEE